MIEALERKAELSERESLFLSGFQSDEYLLRRWAREADPAAIREMWNSAAGGGSWILNLIADESGILIGDYLEKVALPSSAPVSKEKRAEIFARDGHKCLRCPATRDLTIDHIIPRAKGGTNDDANLQTLCRPCNSRKGTGL